MLTFFKYLSLFILFGIIWFFIFSIPVNKSTNLLLAMQKELNMQGKLDDTDQSNKKAIDRERVIDAMTKAFEDK
ncbi:hypothetical protein [Fluviispira multicolorata]|uniref:Uncharacterized protein n=1 Tax=Fluviispira multicolorata TaxID=2654512 RepID=A0A833N2V1_9BACT|nr:hypothetical protein [Fluviispira multicolorata]KAB8033308.1 hypothetical protein GCL57_01015 [Fluviispira multicolorata]